MQTARQMNARNREYLDTNSPIAQQLSSVGFKPTQTITPTIENVIDGLLEPVTRPRKVVITKAGGFVMAGYHGRKTFVISYDAADARKRLKTWDGGAA